jgi:L-ascorbate metabolism protein UlaG (beta-lactamase superfamily)
LWIIRSLPHWFPLAGVVKGLDVRRRLVLALLTVIVLFCLAIVGAGCAFSAPGWHGPRSDHFDGTRFRTPGVAPRESGIAELIKWQTHRDHNVWPGYHDEPSGPPHRVAPGQLRVTFINHATTLLQLDGVNVLTDPIWADRASPVSFIGPHRVRPPGIKFEELPPIDAVLLSHNHYDHLDLRTLRRLQRQFPHLQIFAGLGNRAFLESKGLSQVHELDWGQSLQVGEVTVRSVKNQHFSNRGLFDADHTLWTAWVLEGQHGGKAYFAGDTGYGPHFKEVGDAQGPFRLAVLPIGAFRPEWFMSPIHQSPEQAVQAAIDLRARTAIPMHFGTFDLADDGETEAVERLKKAAEHSPGSRFVVLGFGEGLDVP